MKKAKWCSSIIGPITMVPILATITSCNVPVNNDERVLIQLDNTSENITMEVNGSGNVKKIDAYNDVWILLTSTNGSPFNIELTHVYILYDELSRDKYSAELSEDGLQLEIFISGEYVTDSVTVYGNCEEKVVYLEYRVEHGTELVPYTIDPKYPKRSGRILEDPIGQYIDAGKTINYKPERMFANDLMYNISILSQEVIKTYTPGKKDPDFRKSPVILTVGVQNFSKHIDLNNITRYEATYGWSFAVETSEGAKPVNILHATHTNVEIYYSSSNNMIKNNLENRDWTWYCDGIGMGRDSMKEPIAKRFGFVSSNEYPTNLDRIYNDESLWTQVAQYIKYEAKGTKEEVVARLHRGLDNTYPIEFFKV